mmetsp:Transcript_45603/g.131539  ORF Transcript_45603/g.131539 Transcript_45603/m.131539 type:complete len:600 (+) Transcript_45603:113-1912(+)
MVCMLRRTAKASLVLCAVAAGQKRDCIHGKFNETSNQCDCDAGWKKAGLTDIFDHLAGLCTQFKCESDAQCQTELGVDHATCPIKDWNCYCGWHYAFEDGLTGFESANRKAKCMGVMYNIFFSLTDVLDHLIITTWWRFIVVAVVLLPFGKKRSICDHHRLTMWNALRRASGTGSTCRGDCVLTEAYTPSHMLDDFAWSVYTLELMIWAYAFIGIIYMLLVMVWTLALWALVIIGALTAATCSCCMALGGGGGGDCNCNCSCDGCCNGCGDCNGCQDWCCPQAGHDLLPQDAMFWAGPHPHGAMSGVNGPTFVGAPRSGDCGDCNCCPGNCCGKCCTSMCFPLASLLYVFPWMPDNAWGGLVGYLVGTHARTPPGQIYSGGNAAIDFLGMGWRRQFDLHGNEDWRSQVYDYLVTETQEVPLAESATVVTTGGIGGETRPTLRIGRAHAITAGRPFDKVGDACVHSSFEDYVSNTCWICQDSNEEWDLWLSCRHLFCKRCSSRMLQLGMPCPLCRVVSSAVLRGESAPPQPEEPAAPLLPPQSEIRESKHTTAAGLSPPAQESLGGAASSSSTPGATSAFPRLLGADPAVRSMQKTHRQQ